MSYLRATLRFIHILSRLPESDSVLQVSSHLDGFSSTKVDNSWFKKHSSDGPYSGCHERNHYLSHIQHIQRCAHQNSSKIPPQQQQQAGVF